MSLVIYVRHGNCNNQKHINLHVNLLDVTYTKIRCTAVIVTHPEIEGNGLQWQKEINSKKNNSTLIGEYECMQNSLFYF